ncbi:hypothetical protein SeLEV6574_g06205 [Synchytrium endobioticum]|uniref:Uncharacterized protein n=1 Tax=Synchytrium endobioticum TaxID=286115 RepID=A0A507CPZ8_9FUNG|nr:hypothetical protein SeLEV6574_g06205 [Synchytrium endobioticum]
MKNPSKGRLLDEVFLLPPEMLAKSRNGLDDSPRRYVRTSNFKTNGLVLYMLWIDTTSKPPLPDRKVEDAINLPNIFHNKTLRSTHEKAWDPNHPNQRLNLAVIPTRTKSELLLTSLFMTACPPPKGILKRPSQLNLLALLTPLPPLTLEKLDALSADASLSTDPKELILSQHIESAASPPPSRAAVFSTSRPSPYKRHSSDYSLYALSYQSVWERQFLTKYLAIAEQQGERYRFKK